MGEISSTVVGCNAHQIRSRRQLSTTPSVTKGWLSSQNWITFPP